MNRQLTQLRNYLEKTQPQLDHPFDRYAYNAFGWQAAYWMIHGKNEDDRAEAARLKAIAIQKSQALH